MKLKLFVSMLTIILSVFIWGLLPGCGTSVGEYCDKVCECSGCSETEREECIDSIEDIKRNADERGCSAEADKFLECSKNELKCSEKKAHTDGCEAAKEKVDSCVGHGHVDEGETSEPEANACESYFSVIVARYEQCGVESSTPGGGYECTEEFEATMQCFASCVHLLPCGCITAEPSGCTADVALPHVECVADCM